MQKIALKTVPKQIETETNTSAVIALQWEKLKIPLTVSVDFAKEQLKSFRNELRSNKGFNSEAWVQAE